MFYLHIKKIFCLPYLGHYSLQVKTRLIMLVKQFFILNSSWKSCLLPLNVYLPYLGLMTSSHLSFASLLSTVMGVLAAMPHTMGKQLVNLFVQCREHLGINKAGQKIKSSPSTIGYNLSKSGHDASLENIEFFFFFYIHLK